MSTHKDARGVARRRYFEAGGDLAHWRGRSVRFNNRKKENDRRIARTRADEDTE